MNINHSFNILGLRPYDSAEKAKRAYRRLVKQHHPDRFAGDPQQEESAQERLKEINQAYQRLKAFFAADPPMEAASYRCHPACDAAAPVSEARRETANVKQTHYDFRQVLAETLMRMNSPKASPAAANAAGKSHPMEATARWRHLAAGRRNADPSGTVRPVRPVRPVKKI